MNGHAVFMTVESETPTALGRGTRYRYRVSGWLSHQDALVKWNYFERLRLQKRILGGQRRDGYPEIDPVKFFEVRSYDDPDYGRLPTGIFYFRPKFASRLGYKRRDYAEARVGKALGYVGNTGGWIYTSDGRHRVAQGWSNLFLRLYNQGWRVFRQTDGRFYIWRRQSVGGE